MAKNETKGDSYHGMKTDIIYRVPLRLITPSKTPIREIEGETVNDLRESIKKHGLLQPILLNFIRENVYEIVFGNHRYYACKSLGMKIIPALITELDPRKALMLSLTENIQRLNLNPFREGEIYYKLIGEPKSKKQGVIGEACFIEQLAEELGKSAYYIESRIRLFLFFDPCLKEEIGKRLTLTNAIHMSRFSHERQREIFEEIKNSRTNMQGTILNPLVPSKYGANPSHKEKSIYCYCPNCGSKHLKGVSVEGSYR